MDNYLQWNTIVAMGGVFFYLQKQIKNNSFCMQNICK